MRNKIFALRCETSTSTLSSLSAAARQMNKKKYKLKKKIERWKKEKELENISERSFGVLWAQGSTVERANNL